MSRMLLLFDLDVNRGLGRYRLTDDLGFHFRLLGDLAGDLLRDPSVDPRIIDGGDHFIEDKPDGRNDHEELCDVFDEVPIQLQKPRPGGTPNDSIFQFNDAGFMVIQLEFDHIVQNFYLRGNAGLVCNDLE